MPVLKIKQNGEWVNITGGAFDEENYYTKEEILNILREAIESIPTPDVSGQINSHNTSSVAHNDIRNLINNINIPVQSVNGKTGAIILNSSDIGALSVNGNAISATKAIQDGNGNAIASTYATKVELETAITWGSW